MKSRSEGKVGMKGERVDAEVVEVEERRNARIEIRLEVRILNKFW